MKAKGKYWYHTTYFHCPVCGREDKMRERRYTKKPKSFMDRWEFLEEYDNCMEYAYNELGNGWTRVLGIRAK